LTPGLGVPARPPPRTGTPIPPPKVQLLSMTRSGDPGSEHYFETVLPRLVAADGAWLADALGVVHPTHHWLSRLAT